MQLRSLVSVLAGLVMAACAPAGERQADSGLVSRAAEPGGAGCQVPADAAALRAGMLNEVNARRRAAGLSPLRRDPALERAAAIVACDNSRRGRMDHVAAGAGDLRTRVRAEGYRFGFVAEALAHGYRAPDRLASVWYSSSYHYPTLMTPDTRDTGIAVVTAANGAPWWAMISARPY